MVVICHRPKPVDPIAYRSDCYLNVRCACGHAISKPLGLFAARHRVSGNVLIYELLRRLRCGKCGARPIAPNVTRYSWSN